VTSADGRAHPGMAGAAAAISAARTVQVLVIFALTIPLTRLLPKSQYGVYAHAVFLAAVVPFAFSTAAGRTVAYFLPRAAAPTQVLRSVATALGIALVAFGATIAFAPAVLGTLDPGDALLVSHRHLIGAIVAASFPFAVAEQVMLARGLRRGFALVMLGVALVLLVGVGGALAFAPDATRLTWALRGHLAATCVQAAAGLVWLIRPYAARAPGGTRLHFSARDVASFAAPVAGAALLGLLATRLDGFWIPRFFGELKPEYLRGAMELPVVGALAFTMLNLAAPEMSRLDAANDREGVLQLWRRSCRLIALATIPVVGAVSVVAEDLFLAVYPDYDNGVPVFRWYVALVLVRIFLPNTLLESTGAPRRALAAAATHLGLALCLTWLLSSWLGWRGVAPAMFVSALVAHWLVAGALAKSHLRARWSELLPWGWLARMLAVAVCSAGVTLAAGSPDAAATLPRIVRAACGGVLFLATFGALSRVARLWTAADVERARRAILRR